MSSSATFYCSQPLIIAKSIQQGQTHYAKMSFIREKYGEQVAPIFTQAYIWFVLQAQQLINKPLQAESPIWIYHDLHTIEKHEGHVIFELAIPIGQAIFFTMSDWGKVLNQRFLGTNNQEESAFTAKLEKQGIHYEGDIFRKPFYPQLKQEVIKSWRNLFRFHEKIQNDFEHNTVPNVTSIQGAIWQLSSSLIKRTIA